MRLGRRARWGLGVFLVAFVGFLYTPIAMVVVSSVNANRLTALPWRGFTTQWFEKILSNPGLLDALRNSLIVATAVATTSTVLGFLGAYALRRRAFRGQALLLAIMASPLAVPWVLLGLGFILFFNTVGVPQGIVAIWIAHTTFAAPLALMAIRPRVNALAASLEEAAADLGASSRQTLLEVIVPLAAPAIVAAFLLTFTLSFDEFIMAWFVSGFEITLPVRIWTALRSGITPSISAISVIVLAVSITLVIVATRVNRGRLPFWS
jgi:spermidine/putrescine transport system permease protein